MSDDRGVMPISEQFDGADQPSNYPQLEASRRSVWCPLCISELTLVPTLLSPACDMPVRYCRQRVTRPYATVASVSHARTLLSPACDTPVRYCRQRVTRPYATVASVSHARTLLSPGCDTPVRYCHQRVTRPYAIVASV